MDGHILIRSTLPLILFSELRERDLKHMTGEEKRVFDRQTRWAGKQGYYRAYGTSQH
jgi:hypothetical protein